MNRNKVVPIVAAIAFASLLLFGSGSDTRTLTSAESAKVFGAGGCYGTKVDTVSGCSDPEKPGCTGACNIIADPEHPEGTQQIVERFCFYLDQNNKVVNCGDKTSNIDCNQGEPE